jgi:hypothetical protein
MTKYALFLLPILLFFNCKKREPRIVFNAFHHWKSRLNLSDFELNYCKELKAKTLYLRFFDVDINAGNKLPEPIAELSFISKELVHFNKIIPTIFITNRTLINTEKEKIDSLSQLITNKLRQNTEGVNTHIMIEEIVIDCDWTEGTKDKFFNLIKQLKRLSNKKITVTIRLHQIKYSEKTGIPPADKGLLMAYNTGDLSDPKTVNSILDLDVLKSYVTHLDNYPLHLDVALPIFSWGIVKRDGQAVQLIPNCGKDFLIKNTSEIAQNTDLSSGTHEGPLLNNTPNNLIKNELNIIKNGYYNGYYLYADDVIKIEEITPENLKTAAALLSQHLNNQEVTVSFFSLDSVNLKRYNSADLREISDDFR